MNSTKIEKAKDLALKTYLDRTRLSGENYYWHVNRIANLLIENGVEDEDVICTAYLHHIADFKKSLMEDIKKDFGKKVTQSIEDYEKISKSDVSKLNPESYDRELIVQTYLNLIKNPTTLLVRLADKVDNIRSAYALPKAIARKVAQKAMYLYSPICQLLGLYKFSVELENEAFKILNPGEFFSIEAYLRKRKPEMEKVLNDISVFIKEILGEKEIDSRIDWRIKHVYSIFRKTLRYKKGNKYRGLKSISDIAAMRIIVRSVEQCYVVEDLLNQIWENIPTERDDYIAKPKPSGYMSIHNTFIVNPEVNLEIQIKTERMHENNEFGGPSHVLYKTGIVSNSGSEEFSDLLKDTNLQLNKGEIKIDHFAKYVYVFTPKGDIKKLPKGSTPIDFAYSVHKDLGNSCVGSTVNGEFQKLSYILQDGDTVEIKVLKNKKTASNDWLSFVKTKRARALIRKSLKKD